MSFQNTYAPAPPTIWPYPSSMWVQGGPKAGAIVDEIAATPKKVSCSRVLHCLRVVGVDAPDRLLAEQLQRIRVTDVGGVQADRSTTGSPGIWINEPRSP